MRILMVLTAAGIFTAVCGCKTMQESAKTEASPSGWNGRQNLEFGKIAESSTTENGLQVDLKGDFLFKVGSSKISMDGIQKVDSIAAILLKYPKDLVAVQEYTDNSGSSKKNLRLSQKRADAVKDELVKQGVSKANVTSVGDGEANPIAPNDSAENRAQNRRAELDITRS